MSREPSFFWLIVMLAAFVITTTPLTLISWHVLSESLAGRIDPRAIGFGAAFATLFAVAALGLGRALLRLEHR